MKISRSFSPNSSKKDPMISAACGGSGVSGSLTRYQTEASDGRFLDEVILPSSSREQRLGCTCGCFSKSMANMVFFPIPGMPHRQTAETERNIASTASVLSMRMLSLPVMSVTSALSDAHRRLLFTNYKRGIAKGHASPLRVSPDFLSLYFP